ncbi:hypothetical protein P2G88_16875 [Aliiglaciecola sp. CAU 1673]|uniref:hypothetical protein n=1 Tax=Aliiglaciecola sp. CAU 1673 TaxID=3032595 RepID=UPI0023D9E37A|nr:hypothetical protein [Aliiglaciecola sp. CAU 1673]MDF2179929.1 hypothetical protein [Aliiglaciecola sp. CAU 1673]
MESRSSSSIVADLFSGAGIGVLLGVLMGLSVTQVVAEVVVGLVALLSAALGLVSTTEKITVRPWRIGAFGICATLSVVAAIYVRTHDLLAPSESEQHVTWKAMGFSDKEAGQLVAYRQLGILPKGVEVDANARQGKSSVLYAADAEACRDLEPSQFPDLNEIITAWRIQKGQWSQLANIATTLDARQAHSLLVASWSLACETEAL